MGAKCPYCGRMLGVKESSKPILDGIEWYNKMACASKECGKQWQTREMIVGRGKEAILKAKEKAKQLKSQKASKRTLKPLPASPDGKLSQLRRLATPQDRQSVVEMAKMSTAALLASGPTWKKEPSGGTGK